MVGIRLFSSTAKVLSHIGSAPITVNSDTQILLSTIKNPRIVRKGPTSMILSNNVDIKGPKGTLSLPIPDFVTVKEKDPKQWIVTVQNPTIKIQKAMWGTVRALLNNNVIGVNNGHTATLKFVGTGYRAQIDEEKNRLCCKVGKCVMQSLPIPKGITVTVKQPTLVLIEGIDKQQVKLFAAKIRMFHPPEPYKGKGIYVDDETIKLKAKKIK
ncbi:hypothetical protein TBLA_0B07470 [Henningerozyma blattae CBS 6284]|uniref:Large ribosomal subunit protein uL6 alpha-beta domain-containing protein n=1 Tax=Henningerozyma blattae (strain ATCC 34711 / CBS 6284 / DSM 70876 / NBRC 10599 / NRRL Y-10934 / UCD 77-7) TaxID=1071380 RepID=I2GZL3_HENB6|nr:hypothetical protein TBLA_0B07470 [Tetrapisispora blattae CBS 6284]CCH59565.1 hypothetical protein TBLA_0B07470 [Tetrapisispora blattae CBS 6284]